MKLKFSAYRLEVPDSLLKDGNIYMDQCNWTNIIVTDSRKNNIKLSFHDGLSMIALDNKFYIHFLFNPDVRNGYYSYVANLFNHDGEKKETLSGSFKISDDRNSPMQYIFCEDLLIEEHVIEDRLSICNSCEFNVLNVCMQCGCNIDNRVRTSSSYCPINKWGPVKISS